MNGDVDVVADVSDSGVDENEPCSLLWTVESQRGRVGGGASGVGSRWIEKGGGVEADGISVTSSVDLDG